MPNTGEAMKRTLIKRARPFVFGLMLHAGYAPAIDLFVHEGVNLSATPSETNYDNFILRKLGVPNQGFKAGKFKWNPAQNTWIQEGNLVSDGYYEWINLGRNDNQAWLELAGIGPGIQAVEFKAPNGTVYPLTAKQGELGFSVFKYDSAQLPIDQQTFTNGKYIFTYTQTSGAKTTRTCYLSTAEPTAFSIAAPANGATNVSLTPTIKWGAVGAATYDLYISQGSGGDLYSIYIHNTHETVLTHTIPSGVLQPGMTYRVGIHAHGPRVNCAGREVEKGMSFTTLAAP